MTFLSFFFGSDHESIIPTTSSPCDLYCPHCRELKKACGTEVTVQGGADKGYEVNECVWCGGKDTIVMGSGVTKKGRAGDCFMDEKTRRHYARCCDCGHECLRPESYHNATIFSPVHPKYV